MCFDAPPTELNQHAIKDIVLEKVIYSNVCIPFDTDWKHEIAGLIEGIDVKFRLVNKTASGNFIVQISSSKKENLLRVLFRAIEKY